VWAREQGSQREGCEMRAHPPLPHLLPAKRTLRLGVRQWSVELQSWTHSATVRQFGTLSIYFISIVIGSSQLFRLYKSKHLKENYLKKLC
jgi:hypothetical protein